MGFSKPKQITPAPLPPPVAAPPPVRQTGPEVAAMEDETRRRQAKRKGYASTLLAPAIQSALETKKTLLS